MYLKLAWRNIWRNKRRTLITLASVFLAVILSTLMMSIKEGIYARMITAMIESYTGFVQIHKQGYWDEQTLDNSLEINDTLKTAIENTKGVKGFVPRIESFALAASRTTTKASLVVGIDPQKEIDFTNLKAQVSEGEYLNANDKEVLIGSGLSEYLNLGVGDTIVLMGQGYHGATAAGKYPIKGLVKFGNPDLSKQLVFLPMKEAQWLYGTGDRYTNLVLLIENHDKAKTIDRRLSREIGDTYEVMHWEELTPDLKNMIETDRVEGYVFMFILYLVISFGLFGTTLMMLAERMHEFGVLIAVGMKRRALAMVVWLEVVILSLLGAFLGMLGAFPVCAYFHYSPIVFGEEMGKIYEEYGMEPVLQASIEPFVFIQQASVVAFIACIIAIYPLIRLLSLKAIKAMRT